MVIASLTKGLTISTDVVSAITLIVGGLLTVFSMWWLYFDMPASRIVETARKRHAKSA